MPLRILSVLLVLSAPALADAPPNIVLIIGDDQAWTDFGFMGHDHIQTPHHDALAEKAQVYSHGYVVSSICRPSLATLATGLYPHQHGITGNDPKGPRADRTELNEPWLDQFKTLPRVAELLGERGYVSHQSGKWWEGPCMCGGFTEGMTHGDPERGGRHGDVGLEIGRKTMQPIYDFIDDAGEVPFFIWYAPFLPHQPHNPPERIYNKYRHGDYPKELAKYYAMCEWYDETVGELLGHLEKSGKADNTLVIVITDNGWVQPTPDNPPQPRPSQGAPRGKSTPYDLGIRTPILLHWPGHTDGEHHAVPVSSIDIAPTILAAAGVKKPADMPGINLLDERDVDDRPYVYGAIFDHDMDSLRNPAATLKWRYIIEGDNKLILPTPLSGGEPELFNLAEDPFEHNNLYTEDEETAKRLTRVVNAWWTP